MVKDLTVTHWQFGTKEIIDVMKNQHKAKSEETAEISCLKVKAYRVTKWTFFADFDD